MKLPTHIRLKLEAALADAKKKYPHSVTPDGRAVVIDASIGYAVYASPEGDIFIEEWWGPDGSDEAKVDRSRQGQTMALVLGARTIPELAELLPTRPAEAIDCEPCQGEGWLLFGEVRVICRRCAGLGWNAGNEPDGENP